jgi:hypothetical protein
MKRFIPLMVVFLLALVLTFLFDDFVRTVIVEPLLLLLWIAGTYLQSLPQFVFWILFVLVALIILVKSLKLTISWPQRDPRKNISAPLGYVAGWQNQLQRADRQLYFRWQLTRSLAKLTQETLTPADLLDSDDTQPSPDIMNTLPPEIAAYFQSAPPRKPAARSRWYKRKSDRMEPALALDPERVVEFLEKETGWE